MRLKRDVLDSFRAFCLAFNVTPYPWQLKDFGEATRRLNGRFVYRVAGISAPRGDGKSFAASAVGLWRLIAGPAPQDIISAALDIDGAKVIIDHASRIVRANPDLDHVIDIQAGALLVPSTGSRWTVVSREHTSSRGRHPDLVLYDECGWARDDELFASLLAGQASVPDPLMLVVSTVGRRRVGPLWNVKTLAEAGEASVLWRWHGENLSPRVTREFIERQRRLLLPGQFAREHQNAWVDAADSFTAAAEVDAAMGTGWTEQIEGRPGAAYVVFVDLGAVHDPSVIAIGHEDDGKAYIDRLVTFQGSREAPVSLDAVERTLRDLAGRFTIRLIRIESWQGLSAVQSLQRAGLPVELFSPTAKAHSEEWPVLAGRLSGRTLVLPPHARLREELLNLVYEVGPQGVRVIDRGSVHQDHAVAVRGVVAQFSTVRPGEGWIAYAKSEAERTSTPPTDHHDAPIVVVPEDDAAARVQEHQRCRISGFKRTIVVGDRLVCAKCGCPLGLAPAHATPPIVGECPIDISSWRFQ
jgi:phage terminase large subunit-like protein